MRILIDIGHPAHVHLFKYFAHTMIKRGHQVLFTVRDKEFEISLLNHEGFIYKIIGNHYKTKSGKIFGLFKFTWLIIKASIKFKPDIYLSHGSIYSAIASFFLHKPNIALEDTGNWEQVRLYKPFTKAILTSTSFTTKYGLKQIYYSGYHELAYLHPNYYRPDESILKELDIKEGERYFIFRFVSWNASHDIGQEGLTLNFKKQLVELLSKMGKVFISSEQKLDAAFEQYRFILNPEKIHAALAFADLFIGEGATMASECAMLGTPAIYVNSLNAGSINEQEKYGLLYHFQNSDGVLKKVNELLETPNIRSEFQKRHQKMLADKIDVTAFIIWFIENFPQSQKILNANPDYQFNFK